MELKKELENLKKDPDYVLEGLKLALALQIQDLMNLRGVNKYKLAEKTGLSLQTIENILKGESISLKSIAKILVALDMEDFYLFLLPDTFLNRDRYLELIKEKIKG